MDLDTVPSPAPLPGPWSRRRRLTFGLTAVALVAGGGVAIAAGQPDGTDTTTTAKPVQGKDAFGGVLHSESVVSDGNGGYVTHLTQVGKIESIDAGNLTVVSEDGYKRSWARNADTVVGGGGWSVTKNDDGSFTVKKATEDLASGAQVIVAGTLKDGAATALKIGSRPDTGEIPGMIMKRFDGEFGGQPGSKLGGSADAPGLKDRMMQRFEGGDTMKGPGPMGGPGGEVRRYEFQAPNGEGGGTVTAPAPGGPGEAYGSGKAAPAEPSSVTSSGFFSVT